MTHTAEDTHTRDESDKHTENMNNLFPLRHHTSKGGQKAHRGRHLLSSHVEENPKSLLLGKSTLIQKGGGGGGIGRSGYQNVERRAGRVKSTAHLLFF